MKKSNLIGVSVIALLFSACGTNKNVVATQQPQTAIASTSSLTDAEIAEQRKQLELQKLQHEMEMEQMRMEAEKRRLQSQLQATEKMEAGTEVLLTFCIDEAMDKAGEYMAGLGISQNQLDQKDALISANQVALSDIITRFLGVIKNGVEMYNKETNTQQRNKAKESQLEGLALSVGEKAVNKYAEVVCRKVISEKEGTYGCYVAVHVPIADVVDEMVDQLEVLQVDVDKARFRDRMNSELEANTKKMQDEQQKKMQIMQQSAY